MANPLKGSAGPVIAFAIVIAAAVGLYFSVFKGDAQSELVDLNRYRWYVDEDGKAFVHELKIGESSVVTSPTGKKAFTAELCYWTKDGKVKEEPTPVLLNEYVNKPGPTYCPDCDRLVVGRNPSPQGDPTVKTPPTRAENEARGR
jgi:hypothetical protein